ncbi:MAG: hypothetical protein CME65_06265 [Halobacteriovoraceae bacterium]|nr:hypothetical protein [Halobacteriovoraceae bacterium]|tara:strand:- start:11721 stop:12443 length:723 start_codon:yes stop_codon:yes gene_type:complete
MKNLLALALILTSVSTKAENVYSQQFQAIQDIELVEITTDESGEEVEKVLERKQLPSELQELIERPVEKDVSGVIMMTRQLIALGKEIYEIVEAGKPVVTVESEPVQILPRDEQGATIQAMELAGWRAPKVKKYSVRARNYLGMTPASFDFMLIYSYGGKYRGKGAYITGAQIKPTSVNVAWGYNLDANFKVQSIVNQGSDASPVAGAVLMIDYRIKTVLMDRTNNASYFINGLGQTTTY